MKPNRSLLIVLLFFAVFSTAGFCVKYPVIYYQTSEGMPQNQTNALIQDDLGYVYVGTQSGIGKFDGREFNVITRHDGLSHNFINCFALDGKRRVWVGTQQGISLLNGAGKIESFLVKEDIRSIAYDKTSDTLCIATHSGIFIMNAENRKAAPFIIPNYITDTNYGNANHESAINGVAINDAGVKYFYTDRSIIEVTGDGSRVIPSSKKITTLKSFTKKGETNIIIVGTEDGLFLIKNRQLVPYLDLPAGFRDISDFAMEEKGQLWIGTQGGLIYYESPSAPPVMIDDKNGLNSKSITCLIIDREKNVIAGTEWGLAQVSPSLFKMYHQDDGLPSKFVWSFCEDHTADGSDTIILGCNDGLAELRNGQLTPFTNVNAQLEEFSVRSVNKLADNDFLLGFRYKGIYRWDRRQTLTPLNTEAKVLNSLKGKGKNVWFGTERGLLLFDGTDFTLFDQDLVNKRVWAMDRLDENALLIGTEKSIQIFDIKEKKFVPSDIQKQMKEPQVNDILVVSKSEILIATELNGLYVYSLTDQEQKHITTSSGLMHDDIWSVTKDDSGNIWLNTSKSLDRYTNGFVSHFNKKTGLFGDEGTIHSSYKTKSGKIYISIIPGFIEIPSKEADLGIVNPILYIRDVKVNSKPVNLADDSFLSLDFDQNSLDFEFIAVSTRKENPIFYKTRLSPLEKDWSEPTQETHIKYPSLPPNDYVFEVMANNSGGEDQWFSSRNKISFTIDSPFWHKWWFITLAVFAGILLILLIVKIRLNALEKQKRTLERLVQERTEELGLRNKQLAYLSVTDPLTDLKNRRYLEEKIKEDISLIERHIFQHLNTSGKPDTSFPVLGVFILDIDYFKLVNDNYGHKAGDIVIVDIAKLLLEMLRNSDTIVRWGGEEFLIITRQNSQDNSFEMAERIRKKISSYEFKIDDATSIKKTVSVGFAHFPFIPNDTKKVDWTQVVSLADSALYISKNNGRNMCVGIEWGEKKLDIDFNDVVTDIKMGLDKKYLRFISNRDDLEVVQSKAHHVTSAKDMG